MASTAATTVAAAVTALRTCGFVLLRGALSVAHVRELLHGYRSLPATALPTAALRDGRSEQLLPFAPPFSAPPLLHDGLWMRVAEAIGADALDLDAVTAVLAPEGSREQELHRDVLAERGAVASVHIPLVALPSGGGELALQPASHAAGEPCDAAAAPAPIGVPIEPGSAIVYDARTCHLGRSEPTRARRTAGAVPAAAPARLCGGATTGYEPRQLLLRYGRAGLETVRRYRAEFRARRSAVLGGANRSAAAWLLGQDDEDGSELLFPLLRPGPGSPRAPGEGRRDEV
ncbi:unnamed protein product [Prorocentrum cordatum]|uniref:Phytanoyl-CoA dioxygenase n=1 Tax=Prorocentrum cordatum TaxID=2364126 RepID=A0ABN9TFQ7_9DINO|nr:unnamed protein product [Polarella glacialis]